MDPAAHKRYLDYRESYQYFKKTGTMIGAAEFEAADREQRALAEKGEEGRDDEEEARFVELSELLLRD